MSEDPSRSDEPRGPWGLLVGCLLVLLVAAALVAGLRAFGPQPPAAQLVEHGDRTYLDVAGVTSIQIIPGPDCTLRELTWRGPGAGRLHYESWGERHEIPILKTKDEVQIEGEPYRSTSKHIAVILLPDGHARWVDLRGRPLLRLQRWSGRVDPGRVEIWLYQTGGGRFSGFRTFTIRVAGEGPPQHGAHGGGEGTDGSWEDNRKTQGWEHVLAYDGTSEQLSLRFSTGGPLADVPLKRTYRGEWSAGDPSPPEPGGY